MDLTLRERLRGTRVAAIFLSYRRSDAGGHAGRLFDRLSLWFDAEELFFDRDAIEAGEVFPERIAGALSTAKAVLVLIGPQWLSTLNERAGGLDVDFVRREVEVALGRSADGAKVLPVLLGGARMPALSELDARLRDALAPLCAIDAFDFLEGKQADWNHRFVELRELLVEATGLRPWFRAPPGAERPFRTIGQEVSPNFRDPNGLVQRLRKQLRESASTAVVARAALHGMGGLGKTQLALKYSHDYCDGYSGVWWFRAETEATLQADAAAACEAVSAPQRAGEPPSAALRRWLDGQAAPWLLVFDNAEDAKALRAHLPGGRTHHVVVTSRNPACGGLGSRLPLDTWTEAQGAAFLRARTEDDDDAAALGLARDLGGLPLALEQAASYLDAHGGGIAHYRELYAAEAARLLEEGEVPGYERSVAATLSIAFGRLSPAAARLLRILSQAAPEPIPERWFTESASVLPPELSSVVVDHIVWDHTVGELRQHGLVARVPIASMPAPERERASATELVIVLHRLTLEVARAKLASEEDEWAWLELLRRCMPPSPELPPHWPRWALLVPHVVLLGDRGAKANDEKTRVLAPLLDRTATYLQCGPASYAAARALFDRTLQLASEAFDEEDPVTLGVMNNFSVLLKHQGDLATARTLDERVVGIMQRVLGEEHPDTLTCMNNLAEGLQRLGEIDEARRLHERVLDARRRMVGEEDPSTLVSMNNLAMTMRHADPAKARVLLEQAFETRQRLLGEQHPDTLLSLHNLAGVLLDLGELTNAHRLQAQALQALRHGLGAAHPTTLSALANLAHTLFLRGDRATALANQEEALEGFRRALGSEHPKTRTAEQNLEWMRATRIRGSKVRPATPKKRRKRK